MRVVSRWISRGVVAGAAAAIAMPIALGSVPASASGAGSGTGTNTPVPVTAGIDAKALPGAAVYGTTPATTPETVSIILRAQDLTQLESQVEHGVSTYLTTSQFAATYGQSQSYINKIEGYFERYHIATSVYPDGLDLKAHGTAGQFDAAFSTQQRQYHVPAQHSHSGQHGIPAQNVHAPTNTPQLPRNLSQNILAVLGLTNYSPFVSHTVHASAGNTVPQKSAKTACAQEVGGPPDGCNTPASFASEYGLTGLYQKGAKGAGETIGIVTLAALDRTAPTAFWHTVLGLQTGARTVNVVTVDGGPGTPTTAAGTGETDLDTEQSGALAPDANIDVYQAPNTTTGFADAFFTAASNNVADSVSASWGESETIVQAVQNLGLAPTNYNTVFNEAFLEMGIQGQSAFASSGDEAAYDASRDLGTTNLSVDTPGASPYVTSAGGTTLPWSGTLTTANGRKKVRVKVAAQRIWGWDYLWSAVSKLTRIPVATAAKGLVIGSGGGYSVDFPTPSYQQGVSGVSHYSAVPYLTPTTYLTVVPGLNEPTTWAVNPSPSVTNGNGSGRAEPDLAADADPYSGYLLYNPSATTGKALQGGWGGTSFVAPQLNGSTAVIDSALGHRVGFWNPSIYSFATGPASPFTPLDTGGTSNDNIYFTGTPGTVYNPGAGLGTPDLSALAADFGG